MLYRTRAIAVSTANNLLSSVNTAADIINTTLTTIDKGVWWCSSKINDSLSEEAKSSWLEHEARLNGFSSADNWKKYKEAADLKAAAEEDKEIEGGTI